MMLRRNREIGTIDKRIGGLLIALAMLIVTTSCAYKVGYKSTYLPPKETKEIIQGEILIYMPEEDVEWIYKGNPTSFTGGATTLTIPLGSITQQIAVRAFSNRFSSLKTCTNLDDQLGYIVAVKPRIQRFEYAYNQLKNVGFAITPQVWVDLEVIAYAPDGKVLINKVYESGLCEGESYLMSGSPAEKINQEVHQALWQLMAQAIAELETALQ